MLSSLLRRLRAQLTRDRFRAALSSPRGAIDLASIMVGVIVIGIIAGIIAAMVFLVIPWSQDEAAKASLDAVHQAESVAYAQNLSDGVPRYDKKPELITKNLLPGGNDLKVTTDTDGTCYIGIIQSATGTYFYVTDETQAPAVLLEDTDNGCIPPSEAWELATGDDNAYVPLNTCDVPTDPWLFADPDLEAYIASGLVSLGVINPGDPLLVEHATHPAFTNPFAGFGIAGPTAADISELDGLECMTGTFGLTLDGTAVTALEPITFMSSLGSLILNNNTALEAVRIDSAMPATLHDVQLTGNTALESVNINNRGDLTFVSISGNWALTDVTVTDSDSDHITIADGNPQNVRIANTTSDYLAVQNSNISGALTLENVSGSYVAVENSNVGSVSVTTLNATNTYVTNSNLSGTVRFDGVTGTGFHSTGSNVGALELLNFNLTNSAFVSDATNSSMSTSITVENFTSAGGHLFLENNNIGGPVSVNNVDAQGVHVYGVSSAGNMSITNVDAPGAGLQLDGASAPLFTLDTFEGGPVLVGNANFTTANVTDVSGSIVGFNSSNIDNLTVTDAVSTGPFLWEDSNAVSMSLSGVSAVNIVLLDWLTEDVTLSNVLASEGPVVINYASGSGATSVATMGLSLSAVSSGVAVEMAVDLSSSSAITDLTPLYMYGSALQSLTVHSGVPAAQIADIEAALPHLVGNIQVV